MTRTLSAIGGAEPLGVGRDLRAIDLPDAATQMEFFGQFGDGRPEIYGELAKTPARAVIADGWKLLEHGQKIGLFRIADDPEESTNLAADFPDVVVALSGLLPPLDSCESAGESEERELSREEMSRYWLWAISSSGRADWKPARQDVARLQRRGIGGPYPYGLTIDVEGVDSDATDDRDNS